MLVPKLLRNTFKAGFGNDAVTLGSGSGAAFAPFPEGRQVSNRKDAERSQAHSASVGAPAVADAGAGALAPAPALAGAAAADGNAPGTASAAATARATATAGGGTIPVAVTFALADSRRALGCDWRLACHTPRARPDRVLVACGGHLGTTSSERTPIQPKRCRLG